MKYHEYANLFPMITDETELNNLANDIKVNGLNNPVITFEDKILDGRNRYEACKLAKVAPDFKEFEGDREQALNFVWSENFHRRHLTSSQKAAVAVEMDGLLSVLKDEAKDRQGARNDLIQNNIVEKVPQCDPEQTKTRSILADKAGTNPRYIQDAKKIKDAAPNLHEQVKSGEKTIPQAKREIKKQEYQERVEQKEQERKAEPEKIKTELPNLILADPPWKYDFAETDNRKIENQYQTATVHDMKDHLPDHGKDCLLLLWATAPKLREAMELIDIWRFEYKTHAVWNKKKIGMGYWFRGQHELLIVATKGKISPPLHDFRRSSIFEEPRGQHSKKPDCVYEWIERAFGDFTKLEMYCRQPRPGWQVWGNEV